jgi:hypothetical protein
VLATAVGSVVLRASTCTPVVACTGSAGEKVASPGSTALTSVAGWTWLQVPTSPSPSVFTARSSPIESLGFVVNPTARWPPLLVERARGREQVVRDEKAARGLGGDLHRQDARWLMP